MIWDETDEENGEEFWGLTEHSRRQTPSQGGSRSISAPKTTISPRGPLLKSKSGPEQVSQKKSDISPGERTKLTPRGTNLAAEHEPTRYLKAAVPAHLKIWTKKLSADLEISMAAIVTEALEEFFTRREAGPTQPTPPVKPQHPMPRKMRH